MRKNLELSKLKVLKILKDKKYLSIMIVSSLLILVFFPISQSLATGGLQNLDLWFKVIPKINLALLVIFSLLFGMLLALQIYNFRIKTCNIKNKSIGTSTSGLGAFFAVLVPACPACLSLAALFLPAATALAFGQFILKYNSLILALSIALLVSGIFFLGGLKKE